jgi:hypothetical protein
VDQDIHFGFGTTADEKNLGIELLATDDQSKKTQSEIDITWQVNRQTFVQKMKIRLFRRMSTSPSKLKKTWKCTCDSVDSKLQ